MSLWELFVIAVGLSMDACAVAVCKGLAVGKAKAGHCVSAGISTLLFAKAVFMPTLTLGAPHTTSVSFPSPASTLRR